MMAARGVSLGIGKINLSDLHQMPQDRMLRSANIKKEQKRKPKIRIKKKADAKTVWAACRAVIFGCLVISVGLTMTVLGYFDKHFSERVSIVDGVESVYYDKFVQYQLKSMQYLGPILMGIGSFILIIACVVTLESRDKHTQIITEESISNKRRRLITEAGDAREKEDGESGRLSEKFEEIENRTRRSISTLADVHYPRPSTGLAPLADMDSLDLHSCSSDVTTERENNNSQEGEVTFLEDEYRE